MPALVKPLEPPGWACCKSRKRSSRARNFSCAFAYSVVLEIIDVPPPAPCDGHRLRAYGRRTRASHSNPPRPRPRKFLPDDASRASLPVRSLRLTASRSIEPLIPFVIWSYTSGSKSFAFIQELENSLRLSP